MSVPRIPIGEWIEQILEYGNSHFPQAFEQSANAIAAVEFVTRTLFIGVPPLGVAVAIMAIGYVVAGRYAALGAALGLALIWNLGLWLPTMQTLSLMSTAVLLTLAIGIPIGVLLGVNRRAEAIVTPLLDLFQTMHPFVYLIPVVIIFGIGVVPAIIATVLYTLPVPIRLTSLGVRQVSQELIEAGEAFGCSRWQSLSKIVLPVSLPSIIAGVNQSVMIALGMVVICALIGAGGLGGEIMRGISRMVLPVGFEGGLAVVVVAMLLDRIGRGAVGVVLMRHHPVRASWRARLRLLPGFCARKTL